MFVIYLYQIAAGEFKTGSDALNLFQSFFGINKRKLGH